VVPYVGLFYGAVDAHLTLEAADIVSGGDSAAQGLHLFEALAVGAIAERFKKFWMSSLFFVCGSNSVSSSQLSYLLSTNNNFYS
jgi:hypothetical protein